MTRQTLQGAAVERSHADARARIPMTEANARHVLLELERDVKNAKRRQQQAASFASMGARYGNLTKEAEALYRAYALGH